MRKVLKWVGIILLVVLVLIVGAVLVGCMATNQRINKTYDIPPTVLELPTDAADLVEGQRLANIRGCSDCHAPDFGGRTLIDDPQVATVQTANLTTGQGSDVVNYTVGDWERAIRHGVGMDGKPLWIMPSNEFNVMSDSDVAKIIAYLQTVPPVDRELGEQRAGPLGRALFLAGQIPLFWAERIDHTRPKVANVIPEVSAEYGAYLATVCMGCHQANMAGGPIPGSAPGDLPSANLTPAGNLANWTFEDFDTALTTGVTPEGKELDPTVMPWPIGLEMTPVEREAIWTYLQSLPAATNES